MSDIGKRLRAIAQIAPGWPERRFLLQAADEIELLLAVISAQAAEIERLRKELAK